MNNRLSAILTTVILVTACLSCAQTNRDDAVYMPLPHFDGEAISLSGDTLQRPAMDDSIFHERDSLLQEAFVNFQEDTTNHDNIIWVGRRLAYMHRYKEAIEVFSYGIRLHPDSPELYRHRGHRWITVRRLDEAIEDLERGIHLARHREKALEPDGIPNALNIPLSNLHFNLWYHLGLAYYLNSDYPAAIKAYEKCIAYADNPDLIVATTYWHYLATERVTGNEVANKLLDPIKPSMEIIENQDYLLDLLLFKGVKDQSQVLTIDTTGSSFVTRAYGVSRWLEWNNRIDEAKALRHQILNSPHWPSFGFIAAEADELRAKSE